MATIRKNVTLYGWAVRAPCEGCERAPQCKARLEACAAFGLFVHGGSEKRWRAVLRVPTRELYVRILLEKRNQASSPPATIPSHAELRTIYQETVRTLAQCSKLDECQRLADRFLALARYARRMNNPRLFNHARRLRARAVRRGGELLERIGRSKGGGGRGVRRPNPRKDALSAASVSDYQCKTMLRVAAVPTAEFERQIESDTPPSVTELAEHGVSLAGDHILSGGNSAAAVAALSAPCDVIGSVHPSLKCSRL